MADGSKGGRFVDALKGALSPTKELKRDIKEFADDAERGARALENIKGGGKNGGTQARSTAPAAPGGANATQLFAKADIDSIEPGKYKRTTAFSDTFTGIVGGVGALGKGILGAAAMALPTGDEALNVAANAERLRFYGLNAGFGVQRRMSTYGSPTSALDAATAATMGAGVGLLPGLSNYAKNIQNYGGILGGAALASNLLPGMGLAGGVGVMANLNRASSVNLLRMIGINVRTGDGTTMQTLPKIIKRLFEILKHANGDKPITANDIAVSAMSGNALDSILNQYFSGDENLRQVVLAGLMQMANSERDGKLADLSVAGTNAALRLTGGSISTVGSMSKRYTNELKLIQRYADPTLKGINQANALLDNMYGGLTGLLSPEFNKTMDIEAFGQKKTVSTKNLALGISGLLSTMETIGGARSGAGALLLNAGTDALGAATGIFGKEGLGGFLGKLGMAAAGGFAVHEYGARLNNQSFAQYGDPEKEMLWASMMGGQPQNPVLRGGPNINVYAYTQDDANILGDTIAKRLNGGVLPSINDTFARF